MQRLSLIHIFRYRFDARGDDGARYVTVTLAKAEEGEAGLDAACLLYTSRCV